MNISVNGEAREFAPGTALDAARRTLTPAPSGWPPPSTKPSSRAREWPSTSLAEGDRVEVLTAVQGG